MLKNKFFVPNFRNFSHQTFTFRLNTITFNYMELCLGLVRLVSVIFLELIWMLSELFDTLAIRFNQRIEFWFSEDTKLAVTTANSYVMLLVEKLEIKHSKQWLSSVIQSLKLCSPDLLIYQHLQIIICVSITPQSCQKLQPFLFYLPNRPPHYFKTWLFCKIVLFQVIFIGLKLLSG